mgnify:CR=1 FL=1
MSSGGLYGFRNGAQKRPQTFKTGNPYRIKPGENRGAGKKGRPKGYVMFSTVLKRIFENEIDVFDPISQKTGKKSIYEILCLQLIAKGLKGDLRALELIMNRTDGLPKQEIDARMSMGNEKFSDISDEEILNKVKLLTSSKIEAKKE